MSFAQTNGYTPIAFQTLMDFVMSGVNDQFGTDYTSETFVGTNWYKYFYVLIQKVLETETKTAEIFQKLQQYIALTNEAIQRPSVSYPGLLESFDDAGFVAAVKPPSAMDAGKIYIAVDTDDGADDYPTKKLQINTLIKNFVAAGIVSQGSEASDITLSNGQEFTFAFNLPNKIPVLLRLTCVESENNLIAVPADEVLRQAIFDNIAARYRLGFNFEPQRYFTQSDALWAGSILLEWSDDAGSNFYSTIFDATYQDLYTFGLEDIEVVIS